MAETPNERMQDAADLAAAARERGMEHLEGAKGQLAEGAERVAAAVDRTADEIEGEGENAISGFGRSVASLMRQLAGGLRERDVEAFAQELGALARRNPGVFLAGSVALGFGIARFFKARGPQSRSSYDYGGEAAGGWQSAERGRGWRDDLYSEEALDLSAGSTERESGSEPSRVDEERSPQSDGALRGSSAQPSAPSDQDRNQARSRDASKQDSSKQKAKPQRSSSGGGSSAPSNEPPSTDPSPSGGAAGSGGSAFTGGKGGGALRGGKS